MAMRAERLLTSRICENSVYGGPATLTAPRHAQ